MKKETFAELMEPAGEALELLRIAEANPALDFGGAGRKGSAGAKDRRATSSARRA